jgi:transcriptional regulator with PAS, ATPase and Fis domain
LCNVNVLISGETGTGKELTARAIHYLSCRAGKPFIPINCGAVPENLFENELFGHAKGAFTGASLQQNGLAKEAEGGTLFLDEISAISPYVQAKLLRLLQDKEYRPLGDPRPRKADIRIIAATNRDLQGLVKKGTFREDLFYRLNIVSVHIPPLRERTEDIPILAEHFIRKYSKEYKKPIKELSKDVMRAFMSYSWPGNIRELEHEVQRAVVMSENTMIDVGSTELATNQSGSEGSGLEYFNIAKERVVDSFARSYLTQLLKESRGDIVSAARRAGKSRTGLWNLIKRYSIDPKEFRSPQICKYLNVE